MLWCAMRTTLTLEPDVVAMIDQLQKDQGGSLKGIVNQALRSGLQSMLIPPPTRDWFQTREVDLGRCRLGSLDDVADVLAMGEGEGFA